MRIFRFIIVVFACGLMLFSSVAPAAAVSASSRSAPSEGEAQLDDVFNKSKDVLKSEPLPDQDEQEQVRANELNVAQQEAKGETNAPENSQAAESVEESVKNIFEGVLPNNK